jgi:hypothetical protein
MSQIATSSDEPQRASNSSGFDRRRQLAQYQLVQLHALAGFVDAEGARR